MSKEMKNISDDEQWRCGSIVCVLIYLYVGGCGIWGFSLDLRQSEKCSAWKRNKAHSEVSYLNQKGNRYVVKIPEEYSNNNW